MDKLKMQTANKADENFKKLAAMFPNAVTEAITGYDANGKAIVDRAIPIMRRLFFFTRPKVRDALVRAHESINKLALVPESF